MVSIAITLNGNLVCRAGIENASMISPILSSFIGAENPAGLLVSGMCDLPNERDAHVYWIEEQRLSAGDHISFSLIVDNAPTEPLQIQATDSPEYLEEQRQFIEMDRDFVPDTTPALRQWNSLSYGCYINGELKAKVSMASDEEHILCSLLWDKWRPELCRIFIRSFGGSARRGDKRETEWLRANLLVGDTLEVHVDV